MVADTQEPSGEHNRKDFGRATWAFLVLFLVACALWRLSYLPLISVAGFPAAGVGRILGTWIDVAIALGLVAGFLAPRWWLRTLLTLVFAYVCVARLSDYGYFYYSGCHIDLIALEHAHGNALGMSLDGHVTLYFCIGSALALFCLWPLLLLARRARGLGIKPALLNLRVPMLAAVVLACISSLWQLLITAPDARTEEKLALLPFAPEVEIPLVYLELQTSVKTPELDVPPLHPVVRQKLEKRFGLTYDVGSDYPLFKHRVFKDPFPFPRSEHFIPHPNIIVFFFESFSAALTSVYDNPSHPGLTPSLEDFAKSSHLVYGFFNSSTPTVTALSCSYCSYLPATNPHTWWLPENNHGKTRLRCLPHILRDQGYQTTHAHTMENKFGGAGEVLAGIGFQELLGQKALENALREPAMHWGYSDHQLHRFLVRRLRAGKHKAPFLLSAATVDSHAPFVSDADSVPYGDGSNELLNSIYTADHAFGLFWNYFKISPYFHNTIVIVLADHAMFPGKEHADVRGDEDITGRYYDRILCGIYNPMYLMQGRSNVVSGQIDLTPTILHMLGLNVRNHFEGHSIFEGRKAFPELVGMHEYLFWIFQRVDGKPTMTNFQLADMKGLDPGIEFDATSPVLTQAEYFHFYQWKKALHVNNRIWK